MRYGVLSAHPQELELRAREHVMGFLQQEPELPDLVGPLAARVNLYIGRLTLEDDTLYTLAQEKRQRWRELSRREQPFNRLPGQLVRIEEDEALLSVFNEQSSREELRAINAAQLSDIGVRAEGDPLVLYEMEYAPGIRLSSVMPGILVEADSTGTMEEAELRQYETPLPSLAELEARERDISDRSTQSAAARDPRGRSE